MMTFFRNKLFLKTVVAYVVLAHLLQIFFPTGAYALTSGPSQPEVQGFTPAGVSELVNVSTGDFSYNIPLMDVEGYPLNLSYSSGRSMEEEAGMVGLGWKLNIGQVNRNMRGLPDDFKGDEVTTTTKLKKNVTVGITPSLDWEIVGKEGSDSQNGKKLKDKVAKLLKKEGSTTASLSLRYNNRTGFGYDFGVTSPTIVAANVAKGPNTASLGLSVGSSGVDINPSLGTKREVSATIKTTGGDLSVKRMDKKSRGLSYNSRKGLTDLTYGSHSDYVLSYQNSHIHGSMNKGSSISFGKSFNPTPGPPVSTLSLSTKFKVGPEITFFNANAEVGVSFSSQYIPEEKETQEHAAYGYMHLGAPQNLSNAEEKAVMMDFSREKDAPFHPKKIIGGKAEGTQHLALAQMNFDIFQVSAHGASGQFRAYRSDVGTIYDPVQKTGQNIGGLGAEVGGGSGFKIGGNFNYSHSWFYKGRWQDGGRAFQRNNKFSNQTTNTNPDHEPFYFKEVGERSGENDAAFYASIGGQELVSPKLESYATGGAIGYSTKFLADESGQTFLPGKRDKRSRRNQLFTALTAEEASIAGLSTRIENFTEGEFDLNTNGQVLSTTPSISRYSNSQHTTRQKHHISEVSLTNPAGSRYVFGIPAYNVSQHEVTFALDPSQNKIHCSNLVGYSATDIINNKNGKDHFFQEKITPAYAYAYLLTGILSPDYVDRGQDGITPDDYGTAHKFNYFKLSQKYKWRTPYTDVAFRANIQEGLETKTGEHGDDKGTFVYGEKELWYPHSIESKHFVAEFEYEESKSGLGALNMHGGIDTDPAAAPRRLMRISLYSKAEKMDDPDAAPIKRVHFEYSYDLCGNVPNSMNGEGKLTLEKVWFTYGDSEEGSLNAYQFDYNNTVSYAAQSSDVWGNYKPNDCSPQGMQNDEFPFVDQTDRAAADQRAAEWELTEIRTPSGEPFPLSMRQKTMPMSKTSTPCRCLL